MANQLQLLPAIDISNGHSVRVSQNRIDQEGEYGSPIETASHFAAVVLVGFISSILIRLLAMETITS